MQKVIPRLLNVNWGFLSVFLPVFILALVLVLRYFFEIYIVLNLIQVVGLFKRVIPTVGIVGIILGAVGFLNNARPQSKALRIFSLIGILLNIGLVYSAYRIELPTIKGTITDVYIYENEPQLSLFVDLSTIKFDKNFFGNPSEPILVVHITNETTIYEQAGNWSWQKDIIRIDQLKENQYVEVKYDGSIEVTSPGQIYATEITVVKYHIGAVAP
jgi:hypothetical protein